MRGKRVAPDVERDALTRRRTKEDLAVDDATRRRQRDPVIGGGLCLGTHARQALGHCSVELPRRRGLKTAPGPYASALTAPS